MLESLAGIGLGHLGTLEEIAPAVISPVMSATISATISGIVSAVGHAAENSYMPAAIIPVTGGI